MAERSASLTLRWRQALELWYCNRRCTVVLDDDTDESSITGGLELTGSQGDSVRMRVLPGVLTLRVTGPATLDTKYRDCGTKMKLSYC